METQIVLLQERLDNLKSQQARLISHFESEQRVSVSQGKRIDQNIRELERLQKDIEKLDKVVFNGGQGVSVRLDRLEQQQRANDNRTDRWIAVGAILISLLSVLIQIIKT